MRIRQPVLTCAAAMLLSATAPQAQSPRNSELRPSTDSSVTTGIGTSSTFRNVPPGAPPPPIENSRPLMWDTPESHEKFQPKTEGGKLPETAQQPPAPPPAEVREDPRTMITRDRIQSPQH